MGDVIPLRPRLDDYDGLVCDCGSAWFDGSITLSRDGTPSGYSLPLRCRECGEEITINGLDGA